MRETGQHEHQGGCVVVDHEGVFAACNSLQNAYSMSVARAALSRGEVIFEVAVRSCIANRAQR